MVILTLLSSVLLASSVLAIPRPQGDPSGQPDCVQLCVRVKFEEASYLAPNCGAADVACLCSTSSFTQAYANCLSDNCPAGDLAAGASYGLQLCDGADAPITISDLTDAASSLAAEGTGAIAGGATSVASEVENGATSVASDIEEGATSIASEVDSGISTATEAAAATISSIGAEASSVAESIESEVEAQTSSIADNVSSAVNAAESSASEIRDNLSSAAAQETQDGDSGAGRLATLSSGLLAIVGAAVML